MKKGSKNNRPREMLDEYDFSKGIRGKYAKRYAAGSNIVVLAPDVAAIFNNSKSVNAALRTIIKDRRRLRNKTPTA